MSALNRASHHFRFSYEMEVKFTTKGWIWEACFNKKMKFDNNKFK